MVRASSLSFSGNTSIYDVSFPDYWRKHELCVDQSFHCFDQSLQIMIYLRIRINDFDTNPSPGASLASSSPNAPFQHVETLSLENQTILPQLNPNLTPHLTQNPSCCNIFPIMGGGLSGTLTYFLKSVTCRPTRQFQRGG